MLERSLLKVRIPHLWRTNILAKIEGASSHNINANASSHHLFLRRSSSWILVRRHVPARASGHRSRMRFPGNSPPCVCSLSTSASPSVEDGEEEPGNVPNNSAETVAEIRRHNAEVMARILGLEPSELRRVSSSYKINEKRARRTMEKLQKFGFSVGSAHLYPELLFMKHSAVENYIRIMQEAGFAYIREQFITKFRSVIRRPFLTLRRDVALPSITKVVERFCDELRVDEAFFNRFVGNLPKKTDRITLFELRRQIIASYFSRLSLGSADDVYNRFFTKYPRLNFRSLNWIRRNYEIFRHTLEFSDDKLMKHCYLLQADPDNVSRILERSNLAGMDLKFVLNFRPRIAMCSYENIMEIEEALMEHEIPLESIKKHPELFTLSPKTIRDRLDQLENTPELRFLKIHPRICRLLYYQRKAMERLEEFKSMEVIIPSIHLLSQDKGRFKKSVAGGEVRTKGVDILIVLSRLLKVEKHQVRESLLRHPHWIHVPTLTVKETLNSLRSLHEFSTEQLVEAIPLLLYPKDKVEQEVNNVITSGAAKLGDSYFLKMVMYFIERPTHFTGDGIWPEKMASHHDEPDDVQDQTDEVEEEDDDDGDEVPRQADPEEEDK